MRSFVAWFAENHVAANLLMLFLLLAGTITAMTMKLEVFPEFSTDRISVTTEYIGASPAEVEYVGKNHKEKAQIRISGPRGNRFRRY